jgi:hypothetical protein
MKKSEKSEKSEKIGLNFTSLCFASQEKFTKLKRSKKFKAEKSEICEKY